MRRRIAFLTLPLAALALATVLMGETKESNVRALLGDRGMAIVRGATRVEVFRIVGNAHRKPTGDPKQEIDGFPIKAVGKERGEAFARSIATVLLDEKSYPDFAKGCIIEPGVVFRLWKGEESVDLILCFECTILKVITRDAQGHPVQQASRDFDPARPALIKLARAAFPNDPEIQALTK